MRPVRLQVVTRLLPVRAGHGGCTYLHDVLAYLRGRGWEIECDYLNEAPAGEGILFRIPEAVRKIVKLECPGSVRVGGVLVRYRGLGATVRKKMRRGGDGAGAEDAKAAGHTGNDRLISDRESAFARERWRQFEPDAVLADFTFLAGALPARESGQGPVRAILTHDVLHERVDDFRKHGLESAWAEWTEEAESELLGRADVVVAISEEEGESLRKMTRDRGTKVMVAPMSAVQPEARETSAEAQVAGRVLFVGGGDAHNVQGLKWFLAEIWPRVLAAAPSATFHVCGSVCAEVARTFPNVSLLGHVEDLGREYAMAEACVVPILSGSGIKIKLVEALTHGRACVTTPAGLRGLGMLRESLLVAEGAEEFSASVGRILSEPRLRVKLEEDGRRAGTKRLSPEKCYGEFARTVEEMARGKA